MDFAGNMDLYHNFNVLKQCILVSLYNKPESSINNEKNISFSNQGVKVQNEIIFQETSYIFELLPYYSTKGWSRT